MSNKNLIINSERISDLPTDFSRELDLPIDFNRSLDLAIQEYNKVFPLNPPIDYVKPSLPNYLSSSSGGPSISDMMNLKYEARIKELEKENEELKSNKKFGLVWEDKPDEQVNRLHKEIPVFVEDTDKAVITNDSDVNHILINGDNFHALTALRASHLGKVDVIYIDPPYNTGNKDFIYNDNYIDKEDGYYHSKWLSFMEKRLILAKELLSDNGVIFVSIDDNEQARLKLLMDNIFGFENTEQMIWHKVGYGDAGAGRMKITHRYRKEHEYILIGYKNKSETKFNFGYEKPNFKNDYSNPDNDHRGPYKAGNISKHEDKSLITGKNYYSVTSPSGRVISRQWHFSKEEFENKEKDGRIYWGKDGSSIPSLKIFINEPRKVTPISIIMNKGSATSGSKNLELIIGKRRFDNPKPIELIKYLINFASSKDTLILDFFAGSGTTAHAVAELNKEDGGNRQCILVTDGGKTETVGQSAKNAKTTTVNIAEEVTYERVKRVLTGKNWADGKEHEPLGGNIRYFKIEMKNVEGLTTDDQKGLFQHHLINHAMIAENTFIKVSSKQDNPNNLYQQEYNVLANSGNSKYLVVIKAHDYKLTELKAFLDTLNPDIEVVLIGERIDKINWVKNNKGEYRIDTLLDKIIENRLSILNSSVFN